MMKSTDYEDKENILLPIRKSETKSETASQNVSEKLTDHDFRIPENISWTNFLSQLPLPLNQKDKVHANANTGDGFLKTTTSELLWPKKEYYEKDKEDRKSTMRNYHSTPDCKSLLKELSGGHPILSESNTSQRTRRWLGLPKRVPVEELPIDDDDEDDDPVEEVSIDSEYDDPVAEDQRMLSPAGATPELDGIHKIFGRKEIEYEEKPKCLSEIKQKAEDSTPQLNFSHSIESRLTKPMLDIKRKIHEEIDGQRQTEPKQQQTEPKQRQTEPTKDQLVSRSIVTQSRSEVPLRTLSVSTTSIFEPHPQFPSEVLIVNSKLYHILSLLGKGGSSQVYLGYDTQSKILVAIKCVSLDDTDETTSAAYKNEISLLKRLQYSDRIIKLYDFEFNEERNCLYVVMEKGDADMHAVIRNSVQNGELGSQMTKFQTKYYWSEMLQTVAVIHKAGIIHSDLKPANFLLVGGRLKLIDFGIASSLQTDMTSVIKDTQLGTFNYMSPEAIQDSGQVAEFNERGDRIPRIKIGVKSDVWSLGCILYNLVYGKTPFQHFRRPFDKMQAITSESHVIKFTDISDKSLMDVMKKCLTRDPKKRFSIQELLRHPYLQNETANPEAAKNYNGKNKLDHLKEQLASLSPDSVVAAEKELSRLVANKKPARKF